MTHQPGNDWHDAEPLVMLRYIAAERLPPQVLVELERQTGLAPLELAQALLKGQLQVYLVGTILAAVRKVGSTLVLSATLQLGPAGAHMRGLAAGLRRLAREWQCTSIETTSYSPQVTKLLKLLGARPVAVTLVMETSDEQ